MSLLSIAYGLLNIALKGTSDFSMFLSFIDRTLLSTTLLLFINNAKVCNACKVVLMLSQLNGVA